MNWVFKELGKHYYDAADAWTALRRSTDENSGLTLSNWERWLRQRDVTGGKTVLTDQTSGINKFPSYEAAARTDHASGNDYMYFNVNDLFLKSGSNDVRVYVSYLDNSTSFSTWSMMQPMEIILKGQPTVLTSFLPTQERGRVATLRSLILLLVNGQASGMDCRLHNGGSRDLTVRFVRVVKMTQPGSSPSPSPSASATPQPSPNPFRSSSTY